MASKTERFYSLRSTKTRPPLSKVIQRPGFSYRPCDDPSPYTDTLSLSRKNVALHASWKALLRPFVITLRVLLVTSKAPFPTLGLISRTLPNLRAVRVFSVPNIFFLRKQQALILPYYESSRWYFTKENSSSSSHFNPNISCWVIISFTRVPF